MGYSQLYIFVEGSDDERFVENVIMRQFRSRYDLIKIWKYAQIPRKKTKDFLRSISSMGADYFFLADINSSECVIAKKEKLGRIYGTVLDLSKAVVVVKEIESWYLAGLDDSACGEVKVKVLPNTNGVTKEQFNLMMGERFDSRIDFMVEVLKRFSIETAKQKNRSFAYFMNKAS